MREAIASACKKNCDEKIICNNGRQRKDEGPQIEAGEDAQEPDTRRAYRAAPAVLHRPAGVIQEQAKVCREARNCGGSMGWEIRHRGMIWGSA